MTETDAQVSRWQDVSAVLTRWIFIAGLAFAVYVLRDRAVLEPGQRAPEYTDLLASTGIAVGLSLLAVVTSLIGNLRPATPFVLMGVDWVTAGLFLYITEADPFIILLLIAAYAVLGIPRPDPVASGFHAVVLAALSLGFMVYFLDSDTFDLDLLLDRYAVTLVALVSLTIGTGVWRTVTYRLGGSQQVRLNRLAKKREVEMREMAQRAHLVSEMTTLLSSTLKFDKVLEAILSLGDISIRESRNHRKIGLVLLFRSDDTLYIAESRGIKTGYEGRNIPSDDGLISRVLTDAEPIISKDPGGDPILGRIPGFRSLRSLLCVPLRAHFENYGLVIFGTTAPNAFNPDHIDILNALSLQATVALQNAVLYASLIEEKERLMQIEEDARKALVRDLHDLPTQTISNVVMRLRIAMRMAEREPAETIINELREIEAIAEQATKEIRHVLFTLRPLALESQGLTAALEQLAEKMRANHDQPVTVKISPDVEKHLDETHQGTLFYLIEEAANNARKYADASMITIQGVKHNDNLIIRVQDNGRGFDTNKVKAGYDKRGSFGMVNMQERADLINGHLDLTSNIGQGTRITVTIPIDYSRINGEDRETRVQVPMTRLAASARRNISRMYEG